MYSKGIMWLDDCRIPFVDEGDMTKIDMNKGRIHTSGAMTGGINRVDAGSPLGRFTPNLLVCDDMLNDGSVSKSDGRKIYPNEDTNITNNIVLGKGYIRVSSDIKDKGTNSRYYDLDLWFDKMLESL